MIQLQKATDGKYRQQISIRTHHIYADVSQALGGEDSAPSPHDLFDTSLMSCTAITLTMFAQRRGMPLESINVQLTRDDSQEKQGDYGLSMALDFVGPLTDEQRQQLFAIVEKCPIHKLMSHGRIQIRTQLKG
ncbi:OsmC family protein [Cellvibrio japonicus]|uniref:Possible hydrolase n=1 Tax=Cellvibrio japonicus (strain Ueda107) TaxID=498211 RepID=B3PGN9_CELJU|nr:OsmC family protein [Cellvibrio japonicus]ACE84931.1 possible hydrolase [Cellvibrio japonicus Ueda107]QEI12385.1 OsmC family protein [Cellvibrio japonicus]QEI15958.1 OsmC family protein [Cellvibrio japonicus]QEI19537.1 OsmC family protein [Cellvibrio japonicus]